MQLSLPERKGITFNFKEMSAMEKCEHELDIISKRYNLQKWELVKKLKERGSLDFNFVMKLAARKVDFSV